MADPVEMLGNTPTRCYLVTPNAYARHPFRNIVSAVLPYQQSSHVKLLRFIWSTLTGAVGAFES